MIEMSEYDVLWLAMGRVFTMPKIPKSRIDYKCQSIYTLKDRIEKDLKEGEFYRSYLIKNTEQNIMSGLQEKWPEILEFLREGKVKRVFYSVDKDGELSILRLKFLL